MAWIELVLAGLLEVVWALGLKLTEGFRRPGPTVGVVLAMVVSMVLLSRAARVLPIGTAYAVWVGIGVLGAALGGVLLLGEPLSVARGGCLVLLLVSIAGLKLLS